MCLCHPLYLNDPSSYHQCHSHYYYSRQLIVILRRSMVQSSSGCHRHLVSRSRSFGPKLADVRLISIILRLPSWLVVDPVVFPSSLPAWSSLSPRRCGVCHHLAVVEFVITSPLWSSSSPRRCGFPRLVIIEISVTVFCPRYCHVFNMLPV